MIKARKEHIAAVIGGGLFLDAEACRELRDGGVRELLENFERGSVGYEAVTSIEWMAGYAGVQDRYAHVTGDGLSDRPRSHCEHGGHYTTSQAAEVLASISSPIGKHGIRRAARSNQIGHRHDGHWFFTYEELLDFAERR